MKQYHNLLRTVLEKGDKKSDRTGTGTISIFGHQMRFDLKDGFPCITTKKIHLKSIIHELLWFLNGDNNIKYLQENNVKIWDAWADENGDLGPIYGVQWRKWKDDSGNSHDQMSELISNLNSNPYSRRHIISAWNVPYIDKMALPPCHTMFQFYVIKNKLSCQLYQRSADVFLGVPFNIASYALLTMMIAQVCKFELGDFVHTFGDAHIYLNHLDQVKLQLSRDCYKLPKMDINKDIKDIFSFKYEDFSLKDYNYHPHIKGKISI